MNRRRTNRRALWFECYQLAGGLLIIGDTFTDGQRERLQGLLLDVLSEPDRFTARLVRDLRALAMKP